MADTEYLTAVSYTYAYDCIERVQKETRILATGVLAAGAGDTTGSCLPI